MNVVLHHIDLPFKIEAFISRLLFRNYPEESHLTQDYAPVPGELTSKTSQHWATRQGHLILTKNNSEGPSQLQSSWWGKLRPCNFTLAQFLPLPSPASFDSKRTP